MRQATKAKLFARVTVMSSGEFQGRRKAMKTLEENKFSSRVSFAFQTVRCAHRPASAKRWQPRNGCRRIGFFLQSSGIYGDKRRFLCFSLCQRKKRTQPPFAPTKELSPTPAQNIDIRGLFPL